MNLHISLIFGVIHDNAEEHMRLTPLLYLMLLNLILFREIFHLHHLVLCIPSCSGANSNFVPPPFSSLMIVEFILPDVYLCLTSHLVLCPITVNFIVLLQWFHFHPSNCLVFFFLDFYKSQWSSCPKKNIKDLMNGRVVSEQIPERRVQTTANFMFYAIFIMFHVWKRLFPS